MNRLTRKLEGFGPLGDDDRRLLDELTTNVHEVPARTDLIREGDRPEDVHLVLEGFACRYKLTEDGRRHIMAYLVPGDFCDLHVAILGQMDHTIGTLSPARVVHIPRRDIDRLVQRPTLAKALWWATLVDEAVLREWLVNVGARDAAKALAHLFCELLVRLRAVGLADANSYEFPLTQDELADTAGVTAVHINRSLKALRGEGLVTFHGKRVVISDAERLFAYSGFNPNYLHRDRRMRGRSLAPAP
jgi:CRP-like cAMP-binding protein